jgi:hypothetical protein
LPVGGVEESEHANFQGRSWSNVLVVLDCLV